MTEAEPEYQLTPIPLPECLAPYVAAIPTQRPGWYVQGPWEIAGDGGFTFFNLLIKAPNPLSPTGLSGASMAWSPEERETPEILPVLFRKMVKDMDIGLAMGDTAATDEQSADPAYQRRSLAAATQPFVVYV